MIPLILIAGFLGAGKTTLLRRLLPLLEVRGLHPAVILNDYRNAEVDATALRDQRRTIVPIGGNCVCCESKEDLLVALETMTIPAGQVLLLEANGTSDTEQILELLTADPRAARFTLPVCVGVIDATRWQRRHWNNDLELEQLRFARHVVLSRQDDVDQQRRDEVTTSLRALNPRAVITDAETLAEALADLAGRARELPRRFAAGRAFDPGADHAHRHHFASCEVPLSKPVSRERLERFLRALPETVLRAKGVAFIEGDPPTALLFHRADTPDSLGFMPLGDTEGAHPLAIFIGVDLPVAELRRQLDELAG